MNALKLSLAALIDFGVIASAKVASSTKSILAKVQGVDGEESMEEPLSTSAAVQFYPVEPDSAGACEVLFLRLDDARTVLTTRDARWQIELAEGETVIRAFGANASHILLKPNGDVIIESTGAVKVGNDSASDAAALASKVDSLEAAFNAHIHTTTATVGTGPVGVIAPPTSSSNQAPFASQRLKVDQ